MRLLSYLRLFLGNFDKSFSLGNAHASLALAHLITILLFISAGAHPATIMPSPFRGILAELALEAILLWQQQCQS